MYKEIYVAMSAILGFMFGSNLGSSKKNINIDTTNVLLSTIEDDIVLKEAIGEFTLFVNESEVDKNTKNIVLAIIKAGNRLYSDAKSYMLFINKMKAYILNCPKGWSIYKTSKEEKVNFICMIGNNIPVSSANDIYKLINGIAYEIGIPKDSVPSI